MDLDAAITAWEQNLTRQTGLAATSITQYVRDARRFAAWLAEHAPVGSLADVTTGDAREYRDTLLSAGRAPATINRALISLALLCDAHGRRDDNPFRRIDPVETVEQAPQALRRAEWNAVRRAAEQRLARDDGLALALICLMRFAGPRVGEVAALQLADVVLSARRGTLIIRRGKGLKHREVPLVIDAREPLQHYLAHRRHLAEHLQRGRAANVTGMQNVLHAGLMESLEQAWVQRVHPVGHVRIGHHPGGDERFFAALVRRHHAGLPAGRTRLNSSARAWAVPRKCTV